MSALEVAHEYFAAWNARDAARIIATFTPDGVYQDPNGEFRGNAIGAYAEGLWHAFPDLSFEIVSAAATGDGLVVGQWRMTGTHTGPFQGLPPSGARISLPGADFIRVVGDRIASVTGYFDSRVIPEQLGLQVLVQPKRAGPFAFGYSVFAQTGNKARPGAFSITTIWNADSATNEIRDLSRDIARELIANDGVIGVGLARAGERGVTVTAWESLDDVRRIMHSPSHGKAMQRFWDELGDAAYTSVWVPERINALWVRCAECRKMVDHEKAGGVCACGANLPDPPPYF